MPTIKPVTRESPDSEVPSQESASGAPASISRSGLSDGELVIRARVGDRWAQETLFRRHVASLVAVVSQVLGSEQDADDVVQDTFAETLGKLDRLREPAAFRSWIYRIALNRARKVLRRRSLRRVLGLSGHLQDATLRMQAVPDATPEALVELRIVDEVLGRSPAEERMAWILWHVQGESHDVIASWLGRSVATVKRRIGAAEISIASHVRRKR